jgi:hypothetical protein
LASQSFSSASIAISNSSHKLYFLAKTSSINGKLIISPAIFINLFNLQVIVKNPSSSKNPKSHVL